MQLHVCITTTYSLSHITDVMYTRKTWPNQKPDVWRENMLLKFLQYSDTECCFLYGNQTIKMIRIVCQVSDTSHVYNTLVLPHPIFWNWHPFSIRKVHNQLMSHLLCTINQLWRGLWREVYWTGEGGATLVLDSLSTECVSLCKGSMGITHNGSYWLTASSLVLSG